jgi:hypothetical protein
VGSKVGHQRGTQQPLIDGTRPDSCFTTQPY